jgi:hypothetical protein
VNERAAATARELIRRTLEVDWWKRPTASDVLHLLDSLTNQPGLVFSIGEPESESDSTTSSIPLASLIESPSRSPALIKENLEPIFSFVPNPQLNQFPLPSVDPSPSPSAVPESPHLISLENDDSEWTKADWRSCCNRCGVLIDGQYIEPQSGRDKINYECGCLDKSTQCIVWGFILSEDHETPPTPAPRDSPPPQVQRNAVPRLKVVMQRQRTQKDDLSATRVEALLSDNSFPVGSSSELPPLSPIESRRIHPFDEERDRSLPSLPSTFGRLQFADQHGANQNNFGLWQAAAHHNRPIMVKEM